MTVLFFFPWDCAGAAVPWRSRPRNDRCPLRFGAASRGPRTSTEWPEERTGLAYRPPEVGQLSAIETDMTRGQYTDPKSVRITFRQYAEKWLDSKTPSAMTRKELGRRLRLHIYPLLGSRPIGTFRPEHIREFVAALEAKPGVGPYARNIFADVQSVLSAAVDDALLSRNPCGARSVRRPKSDPHPVVPWAPAQVFAVRAALLERYRAMVDVGAGCGLRQGEVFGGCLQARRDHVAVGRAGGPKVSARLIFTAEQGGLVWRSNFNGKEWKPALAVAGLIPPEADENGKYESAREHGMHALRHFYASALLDAGENIKAVSEYMGARRPGVDAPGVRPPDA